MCHVAALVHARLTDLGLELYYWPVAWCMSSFNGSDHVYVYELRQLPHNKNHQMTDAFVGKCKNVATFTLLRIHT